jgi:Na+/melibiose symporter-like transporter
MTSNNSKAVPEKKGLGNVFYIGLLSFFGGISQDIFVPILPLYLTNVLGLDKTFIGVSEGLVTSSASIFRAIAGFLTDKYGKKKPFIFLVYSHFYHFSRRCVRVTFS